MSLETKYLYLGLLVLSMAYPLAQSFEWRLRYFRKWKYLFPGILLMMGVFIPWDVAFTHHAVWWFNDRYLTGTRLFLLPIEEWLFFGVVPFACVFIYEVLNFFVKKDVFSRVANPVYLILALTLVVFAFWYFGRWYTTITFLATAVSLVLLVIANPPWKGRFLFMYLVSWLPFVLINGALTGNFTAEAVVNYNPDHFMGFRITTIPVEDSVYSLLMLLIVVSVYEYLQRKGNSVRT